MTISKGKTCRAIMVRGRLVNPGVCMRVEESCIIDAARVLIQKHPSVARPSIGEFARFLDVLVKPIPTSAFFCITLADANVAGHAPDAFAPAFVSLHRVDVNIGGAFED